MSGPISPAEAEALKVNTIPDEVFEAFNELIASDLYDGRATVDQDEAVNLAASKLAKRHEYSPMKIEQICDIIYKNHWADIESSYRKAGWSVEYDKPDYTETRPALFKFKKKKHGV